MNKVQHVTLLNHCKKGEFQSALELIHLHLENDIGIKLLVNCCHSCLDKNKNICTETLYKLLKCIVPTIQKPNEVELVNYIQSVYHIINSFIKKDSLNYIPQMEDILLPKFLPMKLTKKQRDTLNSVIVILHNTIAEYAIEKNGSKNEILFKMSLLISKISNRILEPLDALHRSYKCFANLICLKITIVEQIEYYKEVLMLSIGSYDGNNKNEYFKVILTFTSIILNNIVKIFDFQTAWEFFQTISDLIEEKSVQPEFVCLHQVLKSCCIVSPLKLGSESVKELLKCTKSLKSLDKLMGQSDIQQKLREKLLIMLKHITYYYQTVQRGDWAGKPEKTQLDVMKFIASVTDGECYSNQSPVSLQIILHLIEIQTKVKPDSSINYHKGCLEVLELFSNQMLCMKEQNNKGWKLIWNVLEVRAYNIGITLWKTSNTNPAAPLYMNLLLKTHLQLGIPTTGTPPKQNILSNCVKVLCEMNSANPNSHLVHLAAAVFLCPTSRESLMSDWIKCKYSARDKKAPGFEEIQSVTLVAALRQFQQGHPELKAFDALELLKLELEQYKKRWKSKVPVMAVLKELHQLVAQLEGVVEVIVGVFADCELPLHEEGVRILVDILGKYEKCESSVKLRLGALNYIAYKYSVLQTISKNAEDMLRASAVLVEPDPAAELNPKENCDVVTAYESSALEKYLKKLSYLDESLAIFTSVVPELNAEGVTGCLSGAQLYNLLLKISYEYRLFKHKLRCLQASQAALRLATLLNDPVAVVQMSGFIIELADPKSNYLQGVMKKADALLDTIDLSVPENAKVVMIYYVCKSKALFGHDLEEAHKAFRCCRELFESRKCESECLVTVESQLYLLNFKFTTLPCDLGIENHQKNTLMDVHSAAEVVFKEYGRENSDNSYELSILLEANEELIKLYYLMRCPREVYTFGRDVLLLSQKLVSPLRCATFLVLLAHADLRTNALSDCRVKLDGMADILNTRSAVETFRELRPSSPKVAEEGFAPPAVAAHELHCRCFYCSCFEYQVLVVEQTRLSALLSVKEKRGGAIAGAYFEGALDLCRSFASKTSGGVECSRDFLTAHAFVLLDFSSHLNRLGRHDDALEMNEKLLGILSQHKIELVHLFNEALVQKCIFLTQSLCPPDPLPDLETDMEFLALNDVPPEGSKTPEVKFTKISFPVKCKTPEMSPPSRRINKRLVFTLSPATTVKKRAPKTPLPKIKIYEEGSERRNTSKKSRAPSTSGRKAVGEGAKKNLMQELLAESNENPPQTSTTKSGAVRKSTRNKK